MDKKKYKIAGIYLIKNIINEKIYIGSSYNIYNRIYGSSGHIKTLSKGIHVNKYLQRAWNKYGENSFYIEIIEELLIIDNENISNFRKRIIEREQYYLDTILFASSCDDKFSLLGYNINRKANSTLGNKLSEESKENISKKLKGKSYLTEEGRKAISEASKKIKGKNHYNYGKNTSIETRKKMSDSLKGTGKGRKLSDETKHKIGNANKGLKGYWKGKKLSEETKKKLSISKKGISHIVTDETKNKIRLTHLSNKKNECPKYTLRIPIIQIDKKTKNEIKEWESASEAAFQLNISSSHITTCCKKKLNRLTGLYGSIKINLIYVKR